MKKRLLALLLALVLAFSMLPTAFATDAAEPAEGLSAGAAEEKTPAEGETEEAPAAPEEPEQPGEPEEEPEQAGKPEQPEEPAAEEAEVAALAADTDATEAYLMSVRLQNGYYKTAAVDSTYLHMNDSYTETVPTGWKNYLHYENGTLTVFGMVDAVYSGKDAVLRVESGTLTINGAGALRLIGADTTALYVKENSTADVVFDFTPSEADQQLSIYSRGAVAVSGDLTIDNAGTIWIEAAPSTSENADEDKLYDTIIGNVYINATDVSIMNTAGGSCVKGGLTVRAEYLQAIAQSETMTALDASNLLGSKERKFDLTVDQLNIQNDRGEAVAGDMNLRPYTKGKAASYLISGCSRVSVVSGDVNAAGGALSITNRNNTTLYPDFQANGAALHGDLTLENMTGLHISRQKGDEAPLIRGAVTLTDCYSTEENRFSINSGAGAGVALEGDLTLINSALRITAKNNSFEEYKRCAISWGKLTMENSHLTVYGYASITGYTLDGEYMWYVGDFVEDAPAYIKNEQQRLRRGLLEEKRYFDIYTGDKVKDDAPRAAEYLGGSIEGTTWESIGGPSGYGRELRLTSETFDFSNVPGYDAERQILPAGTELRDYLTLNVPGGGDWTLRTREDTNQGATELRLILNAWPKEAGEWPILVTISGEILQSGKELTTTKNDNVKWIIRGPAQGVDWNDIRTAEDFQRAVGGERFAEVSEDGQTVTLRKNVTPERGMFLTGNFTIDLNGHNIVVERFLQWSEAVLYSKSGKQKIIDSEAGTDKHGCIANGVNVCGGKLILDRVEAFGARVDSGWLMLLNAKLQFRTMVWHAMDDASAVSTYAAEPEAYAQSGYESGLSITDGKVTLNNTEILSTIAVSGGELTIEDGDYNLYGVPLLQQTGGTVNIEDGSFSGSMLVSKGSLNITGGSFTGSLDGGLCLSQSGGKVTIENAELYSQPVKMTSEDGQEKPTQHCIELQGGELEIRDTTVGGAIYMYNKAHLRLLDESVIRTVNAAALYAGGGTATILNSTIEPAGVNNLAVYVGDGASVSMDSGELVGYNAGVTIGKGGSFTLKDGSISSALKGIWLPDSKGKLTVTGGEVASPEVAIYAESGNSISLAGGEFMGGMNAMFIHNGTMKNWLAKDCEMQGDSLSENFDPAKEFQTGAGTVKIVAADYVAKANKANAVLEMVPSDTSKSEKKDLDAIVAAEEACDEASADKNVKKYLDKNLIKRVKAARKAYDKNAKAAQKVQAMIDALPDVPELEYARHRKAVDKAKKAFDKLTPAQRTFLTQDDEEASIIGAESKLNACIEKIKTLANYEQTIKTAQAAFKKIPEWSKLKKSDESKVEAARKAMDALLEQEEAAGGFIIPETDANRQKCEKSIKAYDDFKAIADEYRKTYLSNLPSVSDVSRDNAEKIRDARDAYDDLGKTEYPGATKNIQSFIDKKELTQLKNLEKQRDKNIKAAQKVTNLIVKLDMPFNPKQAKAIDAAWKAYEKLGSDAVKSFVENVEKLTELHYQLLEEQRPRVWSVIDSAYVEYPKGDAVLKANVVDLDAKTTKSTVRKLSGADTSEYYDDTNISFDASLDADAAKNFAEKLAAALKKQTPSQYSKDYDSLYDHLFRITTDKDVVLSVKVGRYSNGAALNCAFGIHPKQFAEAEDETVNLNDYTIKVGNGKPYLEITEKGQPGKNIALDSKTRFLVHNMDGTYSAYTGYENVPSLIAHYAEVVFDADQTNELVAEVVYLTYDVSITDSEVVAYVGKGLGDMGAELEEDDDATYAMTIWVDGTQKSVYVTKADAEKYFTKNFKDGFYAFQRVEIGGVTVMRVVTAPGGFENRFLNQPNKLYFNGTIIKIGEETYPLADNYALYAIQDDKVEKLTANDIKELGSSCQAYVDLNGQDQATAIYVVLGAND